MFIVFVLAVLFCVYTYVLFPLILHFCARRHLDAVRATDTEANERIWPTVSIIIAAHNERARLPDKLRSLDALDYPRDSLQIVIVSDGSTDGTDQYLEEQAHITSEHYTPAAGKPTALNRALEVATGEYLVYMDARQGVSPNAVRALIERFDDQQTGAVSGELVLSDDGMIEATNVGLYWRYEKWIRLNESRLFSTTGATGALYAIRRADASILHKDTLLDDFEIPVSLLQNGKRTVFEPSAKVFDRAEEDSGREFVRKARTLAGNFQAFSRHKWLFSPVSNPVWWQFLSHKVARLLVPYAMLVALIASVLGQGDFLAIMLFLQVMFYATGIAGFLIPSVSKNKLINFIKVFLQLNAAAVVGAFRYFTGRSAVRWKTS